MKADDEGELHPTISWQRFAFQLGGTAAVAKLVDDIAEEAVAAGAGIARLYGLAGADVFLFFQFSFDYVSWMQFHLVPFFMRESQKSFSQLTGNLSSCEVHRQY